MDRQEFVDMARVANNLPEVAQMLDLAREAFAIHGVQDAVPPTRVWMADPNFDWYCKWLSSGTKKIQIKDSRGTKRHKGLLKSLDGPSDNRAETEVTTKVRSNSEAEVAHSQEADALPAIEDQRIEYPSSDEQGSLAQNKDKAGEAGHPYDISGSMEKSTVADDRGAGQADSDEDNGEFDLED